VVSCCTVCFRWWAILPQSRPRRRAAFFRFFEPCCLRETARWQRLSCLRRCLEGRGLGMTVPSERVASVFNPKSTPNYRASLLWHLLLLLPFVLVLGLHLETHVPASRLLGHRRRADPHPSGAGHRQRAPLRGAVAGPPSYSYMRARLAKTPT